MARPRIQFQLPQSGLQPVASPVDTFYQPNPVPPEEAVTNAWTQLAQGLAALSPSLAGFLQESEKSTRAKMPAEAEAAMARFEGDASIFKDLPRMTGEEAEEWFKANQDAFGGSEFRYAARPDFQLAFQVSQGRWEVNHNKRFTLEDGTPVTYKDYLYSRSDELSQPNANARGVLDGIRREFFEGLDPEQTLAYREGVISAAGPIENQFLNTVEARQVAATDALKRQAVVDELLGQFDAHRQGAVSVTPKPAGEDETPAEAARRIEANEKLVAENAAREEALEQSILSILQGPEFVGGLSKNKVLFEAIDTMARVTQSDTEDGLEAQEFLEWAKTLPGLNTAYWLGKFEEIEANIDIRERQRGKEKETLSSSQALGAAEWRAYEILSETEAESLEEALAVLNQPENKKWFSDLLSDNKLNGNMLESFIGNSAESYMRRNEGLGYPTTNDGRSLRDELNARIVLEGANPEIMSILESPETMELLGGSAPGGTWDKLVGTYREKEKAGVRDPDFRDRANTGFGLVFPTGERNQYSAIDQARIGQLEQQFTDELRTAVQGVDDLQERTRIQRELEADYRERDEVKELQERNIRVASGVLYEKGLPAVRSVIDAEVGRIVPLTEDIINSADPSQSRRGVPIQGASAAQAKAQLELKKRVEPYIQVLSGVLDSQGVTEIARRNDFISESLILGYDDPAAGIRIPPLDQVIGLYEKGLSTPAPEADVEVAAGVPEGSTVAQVKRSEQVIQRLTAPMDIQDAQNLGATELEGFGEDLSEWARGSQYVWQSSGDRSETYSQNLQAIHTAGDVRVFPLGTQNLPASMREAGEARDLTEFYPSTNQQVLIYTSHLLRNPSELQPSPAFRNDGDFMSDAGVDFNQYAGNRAALLQKYKAAKLNQGLTVDELRLGRTVEGVQIDEVFGPDRQEWPIQAMFIGPSDPAEFRRFVTEWEQAEDPLETDLGWVMDHLGIVQDQPVAVGDERTHGQAFVSMLSRRIDGRIEALGEEGARLLGRSYSDIPRMTMGRSGLFDAIRNGRAEERYRDARTMEPGQVDNRIHSPAVRRVLEEQKRFEADLKALSPTPPPGPTPIPNE